MSGIQTLVTLPDGQNPTLPTTPTTWTEEMPVTAGILENDCGGAAYWHRQRPMFQGVQTATMSVFSSTWTSVTSVLAIFDNYKGQSDPSNSTIWYAPISNFANSTTGDYYLAIGYIPFTISGITSPSTHVATAGLSVNGGAPFEGAKASFNSTSHLLEVMVVDIIQMGSFNNADHVALQGWQNTGVTLNTVSGTNAPSLTVRWIAGNYAYFSAAGTPAPHTWIAADQATADATGSSPVSPGVKVPLNRELRDVATFINNPPFARLSSAGTSQTLPGAGVWTSISFPSVALQNYLGWASGSPTGYTCLRAGVYYIAGTAAVTEVSASSGYRASRIKQTLAAGGSTIYAGTSGIPTSSGTTGTSLMAIAMIRMAVGDFVELQFAHTASSALPVNSGATNFAKMVVVWMSA